MQAKNLKQNQQIQPKNQKILIYVLILLVLLSLGASGFLFYQNYQLKQQLSQIQESQQTPSIIPSPKPTQLPTASVAPLSTETTESEPEIPADWKTYTNEEYGFSFSYPSYWNLDEKSLTIYNYDVNQAPGRSYDPKIDGDLFKITISLINNFSNINSWFENEKKKISPITEKPYQFLNIRNTTVDSQKGLVFEMQEGDFPLNGVAIFETPDRKLVYYSGGLNYKGNRSTFDQILSTFKFID